MISPRKIVENLPLKKREAENQNQRLKLDKNENIYGVSNFIINSIKNTDFDKINSYQNPDKLLDKLSQKHQRKKDNFILTSDCEDALNLIINTYLSEGDEILSYNNILSPFIELQGAVSREIEYEKKYKFNIEEIEKNISNNTKILYFSTPDTITGELVRASLFNVLIKKHPNILFVINCSYINFADNVALEDYLDLADKYDNIAICKSFSYDYALAGVGLGFIYAQNSIIENIQKIAPEYPVNIFAIQSGCSVLNDEKYFNEIKLNNINARNLFCEGLSEKGFLPHPSSANFILCDFLDYSDFYYQKLKNNGVIVKRFDKNSQYSTCLRITVPKTGGIKYILELLNKKDILIINPDNVLLDTKESIDYAIAQTFKHFTGFSVSIDKIMHTKNLSGYNCAWDIIRYLLEEEGYYTELEDIINVFINFFYNPKSSKGDFIINKDKLLISKDTLEVISKKYDLVIFTDRFKMHLDYSLEKNEVDKYFHYKICADDLIIEHKKPNPEGLLKILKHCPHKSIKYMGSSVDDVIGGNNVNIETLGVVSAHCDKNIAINNFRHLGAKHIIENINEITQFLE